VGREMRESQSERKKESDFSNAGAPFGKTKQ